MKMESIDAKRYPGDYNGTSVAMESIATKNSTAKAIRSTSQTIWHLPTELLGRSCVVLHRALARYYGHCHPIEKLSSSWCSGKPRVPLKALLFLQSDKFSVLACDAPHGQTAFDNVKQILCLQRERGFSPLIELDAMIFATSYAACLLDNFLSRLYHDCHPTPRQLLNS